METSWTKRYLLPFCGFALSLGIALPILIWSPEMLSHYPIPGRVLSAVDCVQRCADNYGCVYDGIITMEYEFNLTIRRQAIATNPACGHDCCQSFITKNKTMWCEVDEFGVLLKYEAPDLTFVVFLLVLAIFMLLGALSIIAQEGRKLWLRQSYSLV